jgi:hypothetical protein
MNVQSLSDKITLKDSQNRAITGQVLSDPNSIYSAFFETKLTDLIRSEIYTLLVSKEIKDKTGGHMEHDYTEQFHL